MAGGNPPVGFVSGDRHFDAYAAQAQQRFLRRKSTPRASPWTESPRTVQLCSYPKSLTAFLPLTISIGANLGSHALLLTGPFEVTACHCSGYAGRDETWTSRL